MTGTVGAGSVVAWTIVRITAGGAAMPTERSTFRLTSVPGNPTAAASAARAQIVATIRGHLALMLQPPSAELPRTTVIGRGGRILKENR